MTDDTLLPFAFPAVHRKKVTAAFDGGRITSDGGVMLLAEAERRLGIAAKLAAAIPDGRDASRITHTLAGRASSPSPAAGRTPPTCAA
jgi:DDE family transposase